METHFFLVSPELSKAKEEKEREGLGKEGKNKRERRKIEF
jgi:hypothetical protein